jgi:hypothetical protein
MLNSPGSDDLVWSGEFLREVADDITSVMIFPMR